MDAFTGMPATTPPLPLTESGQVSLADEVLHQLAGLPFPPGTLFTRVAWLIMIGPWGCRTRAVLPIDDRRGRPEPAAIAGLCDLIAMLMKRSPLVRDDEPALVVLHRPGIARVSDADRYILRVLCGAAARRDTICWTFSVATPHGVNPLGEGRSPRQRRMSRRVASTREPDSSSQPSRSPRSSSPFPELWAWRTSSRRPRAGSSAYPVRRRPQEPSKRGEPRHSVELPRRPYPDAVTLGAG
jgi:hypothetical protein